MRFYGIALATSAFILTACGGGDSQPAADSAAAPAVAPTTEAPAATAGTPAPITGTTHEINMVGDEKGYRFEPANITVKAGDGIKFVNVSGGPHNVAFDPANIPDDVEPQLAANMPEQMAPLSGKLLVTPNEAYTISFANVKAGKYDYHCTPHLAMGMKGQITVQ